MSDQDQNQDAGADGGLKDAAFDFLDAHPEIRQLTCETASAFVLAVDRYTDACEEQLYAQPHHDHQEEDRG